MLEKIKKLISNLSKRERILALISASFVILTLFVLSLSPVMSSLKNLDNDIQTNLNNLKTDYHVLSYKDQILAEEKVLKKFYPTKSLDSLEVQNLFSGRIEGLARDSGLAVRLSAVDREEKKGVDIYSLSVECNGKLKDFIGFVHAINTADDPMKVIKFTINAKKGSGEDIVASLSIAKAVLDIRPAMSSDNASESSAASSLKAQSLNLSQSNTSSR